MTHSQERGRGIGHSQNAFAGSRPASRISNIITTKRKQMYIKPTATYKMSKTTKVGLALTSFKTKDQRDAWRKAMIQAELSAAQTPKGPRGDKKAPRVIIED